MSRHLAAWVALATLGCAQPASETPADAEPIGADAARSSSDATAAVDDGALPYPRQLRVVFAQAAAGQLVSMPFDGATARAGAASIHALGARIDGIAQLAGEPRWVVATGGDEGTRLRVVSLDAAGAWSEGPIAAMPFGIDGMVLSADGRWLWARTTDGLRLIGVTAAGTLGDPVSLGDCDARAVLETDQGAIAVCGHTGALEDFEVDAAGGPRRGMLDVALEEVDPVGLVRWGAGLLVHGRRANGVSGSENRVLTVSRDGVVGERLALRAPTEGPDSSPYATVITLHPTLQVAYALQGGAYAYGGNHLAVVGVDTSGRLTVVQYLELPFANAPNSVAAAVDPDGRWLVIGTRSVGEVRAWPIDPADGSLGSGIVVSLADDPTYVGFAL